MANIRSVDMLVIDDLFEMGSGYVLNFSDRTFAQFFGGRAERRYRRPGCTKNTAPLKPSGFAVFCKRSMAIRRCAL